LYRLIVDSTTAELSVNKAYSATIRSHQSQERLPEVQRTCPPGPYVFRAAFVTLDFQIDGG